MSKKYFFILLALLTGSIFLFYEAQKLLILTDLSTLPLNKNANPDLLGDRSLSRPPVYLVSYADGQEVYFQNQLGLAQSSLGRGVDFVLNYKRSLLDPNFLQKNKKILDQKTGAGFWLWKPYIILDALKKAPENAIIIYIDGGFLIKNSLEPLIERAKKEPILLTCYEKPEYKTAKRNVKREVFIQLGCDNEQCHEGLPLSAGFLVLRNSPEARSFIGEWLYYAQNPDLIMNGPSSKPELEGFENHSHDQAILTTLYNRNPKRAQLIQYDSELQYYVTWKHRRPGAKVNDSLYIYESLVPYYNYTSMTKTDLVLFNAPWLKWLRYMLQEERR